MRVYNYIFFIFLITFNSLAYAHVYYRDLPAHVTLHKNDKLIINYDNLSAGHIVCDSNYRNVVISYNHRGFRHTVTLPIYLKQKHAVLLEDNHIPNSINEILVDTQGQFEIDTPNQDKKFIIRCVQKKTKAMA